MAGHYRLWRPDDELWDDMVGRNLPATAAFEPTYYQSHPEDYYDDHEPAAWRDSQRRCRLPCDDMALEDIDPGHFLTN